MPNLLRKAYPLEIKELNEEGYFSGYGSVFDVVDDWDDVIVKGAFANSIAKKTPVMLWQHDSAEPIGVYERVSEDDIGLWLEGRLLLDVEKGREAYVLLKNRAISGLSIGFVPLAWEWETRDNKRVRVLKDVDLWEVSLVTFPANPKASVDNVKSIQTVRDAEAVLRDAGLSKSDAGAVLAACKSALQRDAEEAEAIQTAKDLLQMFRSK